MVEAREYGVIYFMLLLTPSLDFLFFFEQTFKATIDQ
jgi:hypothetical protein